MIPTDTDGLLKDAGGARPASDVDALIERLQGFNPPDRTIASQRDYSQAIHDAAAALVQLREENAEVYQANDYFKRKAERAEAEVARLTTKCKYGDPMCPCQDGDACHYEGDNPMTPPPIAALKARIAALEAERDCANDRAATHLADAYSMRDQRDALAKDAERTHERICQAIDCRNMGDHAKGWDILRQWLVDVADAAREKP